MFESQKWHQSCEICFNNNLEPHIEVCKFIACPSSDQCFLLDLHVILQGLPGGILCQMDDVLVNGKNKDEHDMRLEAALFSDPGG